MKRLLPILAVAILSVLIVMITPSNGVGIQINGAITQSEVTDSLLQQSVSDTLENPITITKIYDTNQLIGVITDTNYLKRLVADVYNRDYSTEFPNTELGFSEDIYTTTELSYVKYENKDDAIFEYIEMNNKFSVLTNKIIFSNGAVIYVKNVADFESARKSFLLNFVSESSYNLFVNKQTTAALTSYGYREVSLSVNESIEITTGYAAKSDILPDKNAIIYYLSYGVNSNLTAAENETYYTVVEGDTVTGIAWLQQITTEQLISTNADVLFSEDQVLVPGMRLNVTKFASPLNVFVTRERLYEEVIEPAAPRYEPDSSLSRGVSRVRVSEETGLKNVKRLEVYLNGVLTDNSTVISEVTTKAAVQGVIAYGTYVEPSTGTGTFRAPVSNYIITCNYFCYSGHRGIDYQNRYQRWGAEIYAGDTGIVLAAGWSGGFGYRVEINHRNGFTTLYAHMIRQPVVSAGQTVQKGQLIGYLGATGNVTGPHVHVEVKRNGTLVNPCGYFPC